MELYLIAAVAEGCVIGFQNRLPWEDRGYASMDRRHFVDLTKDHAVLMGRNTYDSILQRLKKPLPQNRRSIVLTRNPESVAKHDSVVACGSLEEALAEARRFPASRKQNKAWVIGGQRLYEQTMNIANGLEVTEIREAFPGDAFFPHIDARRWEELEREEHGPIAFVSYRSLC